MNLNDMNEDELKYHITNEVMKMYSMKEYRDEALKSEFIFYGVVYVPDMFDENFKAKEVNKDTAHYYLISDHHEDFIPWPILISDLMATMPFHNGPYDKEIWEMAFSFMDGKPVYMTHNLWTCDCIESQFIWDIGTICFSKCGCVEDEESMEILKKSLANVIEWKPKSNRIPYLYERFDYPLKQYEFDITKLNFLIHETFLMFHGAHRTTHNGKINVNYPQCVNHD